MLVSQHLLLVDSLLSVLNISINFIDFNLIYRSLLNLLSIVFSAPQPHSWLAYSRSFV